MKLYYFATKAALANANLMSDWHYIDLPDGTVIVAARFTDEGAEIAWSLTAGVTPLAHPLSNQPSTAQHASRLAHLGVLPTDNTFAVSRKVGAVHPQMRMTMF